MLNTQRGPWKTDLDFAGEVLHVRPRNDTIWHPLSDACPCRPEADAAELRDSDGDPVHLPVLFHNALDGRAIPPPRPGC